jgi:hypothetical protein
MTVVGILHSEYSHMNFDPTSITARGLPTRGAWATDPNIYSGADFVTQGSGTVTISYVKNAAIVSFSGLIYTPRGCR